MSVTFDTVIGKFHDSARKFEEQQGSEKLKLLEKIETVAHILKCLIFPGIALTAIVSLLTFSITPLTIGLGIGLLGCLALRVANYATNNLLDNIRSNNEIDIISGYFEYYSESEGRHKDAIQKITKRIIEDFQFECQDIQKKNVKVNSISWKVRGFIGHQAIRLMNFLEIDDINQFEEMIKLLEQRI
ncbi:MAG: hypothetical protein K940chlam7_02110 [Chlamydiae bacterium]|nr:hypothetical protein [Chlamydiota bacterium]